ncbi:hypothetical protein COCON_G00170130 [Conger conger]|uniref:Uncharacterized protein n=1 Tax=Conger conger TaxID=82655 RepID=A0A9Q1HU30_CONCO|nr:hypothetical protein COCON_G00170130 [Conger conger]
MHTHRSSRTGTALPWTKDKWLVAHLCNQVLECEVILSSQEAYMHTHTHSLQFKRMQWRKKTRS